MQHYKLLQFNLKTFLMIMLLIIITGCATTKMPLSQDISSLNMQNQGIAIMTLKISNQYAPKYQPKVWGIKVHALDGSTKTTKSFKPGDPYESSEQQYYKYLISFQLLPGKYKVGKVDGRSILFPVMASFQFQINAEFEVKPNTITYIGYVEMVNRKKKDGEPSSGILLPLIDQLVSGYANGTFDITISDEYERDIALFNQYYPFIKDYELEKNIALSCNQVTVRDSIN